MGAGILFTTERLVKRFGEKYAAAW
nr:hypothetical protein [Staphylococcus kloosii]